MDSSYAIALAVRTDENHKRAVELAQELKAQHTRLVTTRAVVLEIANALSRLRYRAASIALLSALENDSNVEIIPVAEPLIQRAFELYKSRLDKEWGLTDCISFEVMRDPGLSDALTADDHFRQAGFQALLKSG